MQNLILPEELARIFGVSKIDNSPIGPNTIFDQETPNPGITAAKIP